MLKNTRYLQCLSLKADDLDNQLINPNNNNITIDNAGNYVQSLILSGYNIYNVTSEGGFSNLTTKAPGSYICIFTTAPTATYNIATSILSGTGGVAHTNVVITSLIYGNGMTFPTSVGTLTVSGVTTGNAISPATNEDYQKLTVIYSNIVFSAGYNPVWNIKISNCNITINANLVLRYKVNHAFENTSINAGTSAILQIDIGTSAPSGINLSVNNNTLSGSGYIVIIGYASNTTLSVTNNYFVSSNTGNAHSFSKQAAFNFILTNNYVETQSLTGAFVDVTGGGYMSTNGTTNILYTSPKNIIVSTLGTAYDVIVGYPTTVNQYISGAFASLNTTLVKSVTASTLYLDCNVSQIKRSIRGSFGTIRRQYYNLQFLPNHKLDDSLKNFDDQDRLLINRTDINLYLQGLSAYGVKGYNFFDISGTTRKYPRIDESFLMLITSGTTTHVIAWHKGQLRKTIYTDYWPTTLYTTTLIFQVWETPEEVEYRNVWNITNSPIEGSITMQDITSKVVL